MMKITTRKAIHITTFFAISGSVFFHLFVADTGPFRFPDKPNSELKLVVVLSNHENPDFYNQTLNRDDIVFTYGAKTTVLAKITVPRTMLGRGSIHALEEELEKLGSLPVDYIQYNPEQWKESHTPKEEIDDLLGAVREARKLADGRGARLSFVTDHVLLDKYGERVAPLVDHFGIQLQRYQRDGLDDFRAEALRKHSIVRRGSRTVPIFFQLSLAPVLWEDIILPDGSKKRIAVRDEEGNKVPEPLPMGTILQQIDAIKDFADGIVFLYDPATAAERKALVTRLRNREPGYTPPACLY